MTKDQKNKKITLDKLAQTMANGFEESRTNLSELAQAMANGFEEARTNLNELAQTTANGFEEARTNLNEFKTEVRERFNKVDDRLERIEDTHYEFTNNDAKTEREITGLKKRVTVLEQKVL